MTGTLDHDTDVRRLRTGCLIGGTWRDAADGETFAVRDPATDEVIAMVASGKVDDAMSAVGAAHEARNGYARPGHPVEVVALRAVARRSAPLEVMALPDVTRADVVGPATVAEEDCTIWVPEGWRGRSGAGGALVLTRDAS